MRRVVPPGDDEPLDAVYDDLLLLGPVGSRCGISLGMVSSVDGAATISGRTADLGGRADQAAFVALRGAADAVLVGAGTVQAENYGPGAGSAERRQRREAKGLSPAPRLVIVSDRLHLDPASRVFSDDANPPLVITNGRAASADPPISARAELLVAGDEAVELPLALQTLAERGLGRVLCEGGPTLNGALFAHDCVDELYLTLTPTLVGGEAGRIVAPSPPGLGHRAMAVELRELREHDGELLLRYRLQRPGPAGRL